MSDLHADRIDALFEWATAETPGAAVAVAQNGAVVFENGYGSANLEYGVPISPDTVFDIASVSKQFAGLALAILAVEGAVDLDADIRDYLPEMDFGSTVTARHLLHHTSGVRDWCATLAIAGWSMDDVISMGHILGMARTQRSLNFPPGAEYCYSNTGYNLLTEIVARVSGRSFREWTDTRFFQPLGMTNTRFHDDHQEIIPNRCVAYGWDGEKNVHNIPNHLMALGSSSLYTSVRDLTKWAINFETGVVGGEAFDLMHSTTSLNDGGVNRYAFGVLVDEWRGVKRVQPSGGWAGFSTHLARFPDERLAVIVLCNQSHHGAGGLTYKIAEMFLGETLAPEPPRAESPATEKPAPPTLSPDEMATFVGEYVSDELATFYTVSLRDDRLVVRHWKHGENELTYQGDDAFAANAWWMWRIEFRRDGDGKVAAFEVMVDRVRHLRFNKRPS